MRMINWLGALFTCYSKRNSGVPIWVTTSESAGTNVNGVHKNSKKIGSVAMTSAHHPWIDLSSLLKTTLIVSLGFLSTGASAKEFGCILAESICEAHGWGSAKCAAQRRSIEITGLRCDNPLFSESESSRDWETLNRAASEEAEKPRNDGLRDERDSYRGSSTSTSYREPAVASYPAAQCIEIGRNSYDNGQVLRNRCGFDAEVHWESPNGSWSAWSVRAGREYPGGDKAVRAYACKTNHFLNKSTLMCKP